MYYWVESSTGEKGTVTAQNKAEAKRIARTKMDGMIVRANVLPYPAAPVLNSTGGCPEFCWEPDNCKGRTSCPKQPTCVS